MTSGKRQKRQKRQKIAERHLRRYPAPSRQNGGRQAETRNPGSRTAKSNEQQVQAVPGNPFQPERCAGRWVAEQAAVI